MGRVLAENDACLAVNQSTSCSRARRESEHEQAQMCSKLWAVEFNALPVPKKIDFVPGARRAAVEDSRGVLP